MGCLMLFHFHFLLWYFAASTKVRALLVLGDLVDHNGEAIGLLRSVHLRESSEQSFSAGVVSTKLGCAGTCACWLAVIALVASPAVLKSLVAGVRSPWQAVLGIGWTN